jgi:HAD superfamily hydrolase (TIGR01509 family)
MTYSVIFDMDGVISLTQGIHARAEAQVLYDVCGVTCDPDRISLRFAGVPDRVMFKTIIDEQKGCWDESTIDSLLVAKWNLVDETIANEGIVAVPGVLKLIDSLRALGKRLAIASGSPLSFIQRVVSSLGIESCFDAFVSSDEVSRGKPHPDVFLLAADRIKASPADCIVIEDGAAGMKAAQAAGMMCIGLVPDGDHCFADHRVTSLHLLDVDVLNKLFAGGR